MNWTVIVISLLSGILGAMGLGGGSVLIIFLTGFLGTEQRQAQGINLLFFIPIATLSVIMYHRQKLINLKEILPVALPSLAGAVCGFFLLEHISAVAVSKIFGTLLIYMGIRQLLTKSKSTSG